MTDDKPESAEVVVPVEAETPKSGAAEENIDIPEISTEEGLSFWDLFRNPGKTFERVLELFNYVRSLQSQLKSTKTKVAELTVTVIELQAVIRELKMHVDQSDKRVEKSMELAEERMKNKFLEFQTELYKRGVLRGDKE